ncbi:MAG TPA: hypothetical protein VK191_06050 [Symbiobacteriaceae bacterium]|nr:hypothetical protein [Symbiobacteriaceae bacterium]
MQHRTQQNQLLQRLGGASVLFIALAGLLDLVANQLATAKASPTGPTDAYLAYLQANPFLWQTMLLWATSALLGMVGVQAVARRLEPYQPVWAGIARTWGIGALLVSALFDLLSRLPFYLARTLPPSAMEAWLGARGAFLQVPVAVGMVQMLLLALLGLSLGMASRSGGVSRVTCSLSFGYGATYLLILLLGPGLGLNTPVQGVLSALAPFLQLGWLIWAGVELIRFPDPVEGAPSQAA